VRTPLLYFLVIAGAWLSSLGACGRTAPLLEDTYGNFGGEGDGTGGSRTGGTSGASSGGSSTGGSTTGGSTTGGSTTGGSTTGGSSNGGNAASPGSGGTGIDDGGATFTGGAGGNVSAGGTEPAGGAFPGGGTSPAAGGTGNETGGVGVDGGTSGSSPMTGGTGGGSMTGGTAGMGGMMPLPPGFIRCGDTACDGETSICCQRRSSPSTCEEPGTNCMGATLTCSGASSCAGEQLCCYHARESLCLESCEVSVGSPGNSPTIILCNSDDECDEGQTCVFAPRGIAYCGDDL
jgi:hypothetical protein